MESNMNNIECPVLAVDVVIFGIMKERLTTVLCKRDSPPFKDALALPGVAVQMDETLEVAARRSLVQKAGWPLDIIDEIMLEQLATFDALYRDSRGRTVSVAYMGIAPESFIYSEKTIQKPFDEISRGSLPFDHNLILETAHNRLKGKMRYTNIARKFLSENFRIEELQNVYEAIFKRSINRANFRNKLLKINMIEQVKVLTRAVGKKGGRPPHLYRFKRQEIEAVDRDFI